MLTSIRRHMERQVLQPEAVLRDDFGRQWFPRQSQVPVWKHDQVPGSSDKEQFVPGRRFKVRADKGWHREGQHRHKQSGDGCKYARERLRPSELSIKALG